MDESEMLRLVDSDEVAESIRASLAVVRVLREQIKAVERVVLARGRLREEFELLCTAPGIGEILAMTIMCETGDISRFAGIGNYTSYCRTVKSEYDSNGKTKGHGNRKNGNAYLSWAYSEAAHHAAMVDSRARRYLDRKLKTSHSMVAKRALANKMARGCFTVLRHRVPFDSSRLFP
jgi:transposase